MLPSTGGVELRLVTYIFVGDSLREVVFGGFKLMIGLRRVLWGIFPVDLSAI
jgi:hypothetical protein